VVLKSEHKPRRTLGRRLAVLIVCVAGGLIRPGLVGRARLIEASRHAEHRETQQRY
jgi:hypothetical protein